MLRRTILHRRNHVKMCITRQFSGVVNYSVNRKDRFLFDQVKHRKSQCLCRTVNTLTPLGTAFNTKINKLLSLQMITSNTGLFGVDELNSPDGFHILKDRAIKESEILVAEICSSHRSRKMVEIFDHLSNELCQVADLAEFIRLTHPQMKYCRAAEDACISIGVLVEQFNTHKQLYESLKKAVIEGDVVPTTDVDQHVARLFLHDFEQSGIHLDEHKRRMVVALNEDILTLGQQFLNGSLHPRAVPKSKLPDAIKNHFALEGENIVIRGLHSDASMELTREAAYKIYLYPDPTQENLLSQLISKRHDMAKLCGFQSYADRAMRGSLAETPELVVSFLEGLAKEIRPKAAIEYEEMAAMKKSQLRTTRKLSHWDVPYYHIYAKEHKFHLSDFDATPYFSLGVVMEGLSELLTDLYNIKLKVEDPLPGELWTSEVYKVAVIHESDGTLGHIYCDFFQRNGKANQDCHFTIRGGKLLADGTYQNPIVVLNMNMPSPSWTTPTLLTTCMIDNLFHEMGHALHSMIARTQYQHVTGTRCSTDFAEVPSILMEFFANDPRVLHRFARHYKTGEKIPFQLLEKLLASKSLYAASELQTQTFYSLLDQHYHGKSRWSYNTSTTDILQEVQDKYYGLPYVNNTAWQLRFGHLVGYGAKYYAYLVSRAVASWIWQKYFVQDPFSRDAGEKYRTEVLAHGGGKPPRVMVEEFLGKEVTANNLVDAFMLDLDAKSHMVESVASKLK